MENRLPEGANDAERIERDALGLDCEESSVKRVLRLRMAPVREP